MADDSEEDNTGKSSQQLLDELVPPKDDDDMDDDDDDNNNAFDTSSSLGDGVFENAEISSTIGSTAGDFSQVNSLLATNVGEGGNDGENINKDVEQQLDPNAGPNQAANLMLPPQAQDNPILNFVTALTSNPLFANLMIQQQQQLQQHQSQTNNVPALPLNSLLLLMAAQNPALLNPVLLQSTVNMMAGTGMQQDFSPYSAPASEQNGTLSSQLELPQQELPPPQEQQQQQIPFAQATSESQPEVAQQQPPSVQQQQEGIQPQELQQQLPFQEHEVEQQQPAIEQPPQAQFPPQFELLRLIMQNGGMIPMQSFNPIMNISVAPPASLPENNSGVAPAGSVNTNLNNANMNIPGNVMSNNPMATFPFLQQFLPAMLPPQMPPLPQQEQLQQPRDIQPPSINGSSVDGVSDQIQMTSKLAIPLYLDHDENCLTPYQCFLRKQIELFEAEDDELQGSAQGRNIPLHPKQLGIRCRWCAHLPKAARSRGGVYYSRTIDGVYQVAQNMSKLHFLKSCTQIPENTRTRLMALQGLSSRASGGKDYWAEGLRVLGVVEDERGFLKFEARRRSTSSEDLSEEKKPAVT